MDLTSFLTGFAAGTLSVLLAAVIVAVASPRPAKVLPRREPATNGETSARGRKRTMWG